MRYFVTTSNCSDYNVIVVTRVIFLVFVTGSEARSQAILDIWGRIILARRRSQGVTLIIGTTLQPGGKMSPLVLRSSFSRVTLGCQIKKST